MAHVNVSKYLSEEYPIPNDLKQGVPKSKPSKTPVCHVCFLLGLLFSLEDVGDMFL
jgi:hypothetical protein